MPKHYRSNGESTFWWLASIGPEILGLGVIQANTLGITLDWGNHYSAPLHSMWWLFLPPVIIIFLLAVGLFSISAGLDDLANPGAVARFDAATHPATQTPPRQMPPSGHEAKQAPQCAAARAVSTQTPPQLVSLPGH